MAIGLTRGSGYSFVQQNAIWRARQQDLNDQMDTLTALNQKMSNANANLVSGKANLVAQAAVKRMTDALTAQKAKAAAYSAKQDVIDAEHDRLVERLKASNYYKDYAAANVDVTA